MSNADSATNMLWLINQATAGEISTGGGAPAPEQKKDDKKETTPVPPGGSTNFSDIKIDMNA
jgi:hypothetical protein